MRRDGLAARGTDWSAAEEEEFKAPIRAQYETQGHPYYASARLWDDGIIDPADTRLVLALGDFRRLNAPIRARDPLRRLPDVSDVTIVFTAKPHRRLTMRREAVTMRLIGLASLVSIENVRASPLCCVIDMFARS